MMFPDSGLVVGPSHSDGGVYASVANGPDVELEGGEFIINKEATEDFLPLIKQINDIGRMEQMNNADNAQNAHSAIDALIASASTKMMPGGGMVAPKTPMYQEGGQTESLLDILNQLQSNRQKYQGEVLTESGQPRFGPEGRRTKAGFAEKFNFPLEEAVFDTLIDTPSQYSYNINLPNDETIKVESSKIGGMTDKKSEMLEKQREITQSLREAFPEEANKLTFKMDSPSDAIRAVQRGYLNMDPFEQMRYDRKEKERNKLKSMFMKNYPDVNEAFVDSFLTEKGYRQGGMIQYQEGGPLHSRRMFNQGTGFDKKKSDLNKDGKISEYEKKRGMAIAKSMKNQMQMGGMIGMQQPMMQRPMNPAMNLSPMQRMGNNMPPMMYQEGGKVSQEDVLKMVDSLYSDVENPFTRELLFQTDPDMKDMPGRVNPMRALLEALTTQRATRDGGRFKSMMGRYKLDDSPKPRGIDELLSNINLQSMMQEARPSREGRDQSQIVQDNLARRIGSSSDIQTPNDLVRYLTTVRPAFQVSSPEDNDNVENFFKMIENIDAVPKSRKSMQMGGQVQLRKQAEMRKEPKEKMNVIFPFINEMPFLYPNFQGPLSPSQSESLNEFLKQLEEEKEKQPKKLMAQEGGMISDNNLMGAMANDRRVAALQPDVYSSKMENGMTVKQKIMVPKLAEAILPVYGVETPLSRRQSSMLKKNAVSPSALNPNVKGLVNRLLVQRLANETT